MSIRLSLEISETGAARWTRQTAVYRYCVQQLSCRPRDMSVYCILVAVLGNWNWWEACRSIPHRLTRKKLTNFRSSLFRWSFAIFEPNSWRPRDLRPQARKHHTHKGYTFFFTSNKYLHNLSVLPSDIYFPTQLHASNTRSGSNRLTLSVSQIWCCPSGE